MVCRQLDYYSINIQCTDNDLFNLETHIGIFCLWLHSDISFKLCGEPNMEKIILLLLSLVLIVGCTQQCPTCSCPTYNCPTVTIIDNDYVSVDFIDVGQGDATLIKYKDTEMLIDCGDNSRGPEVADFLKEKGVTYLEYLMITHPDSDHLGGCDDVLRRIPTHTVITNGESKDTVSYREVMAEIDKENIIVASEGNEWSIGPAILKVLSSNTNSDDSNQNSIVSKLSFNDNDILLTADCDNDCERGLLDKDIEAEILRVAHHGSKYATGIDLLEKVNASVAIISVGDNSYGHPTPETLDRITQEGIALYRTDRDGTISIRIDDDSYQVE